MLNQSILKLSVCLITCNSKPDLYVIGLGLGLCSISQEFRPVEAVYQSKRAAPCACALQRVARRVSATDAATLDVPHLHVDLRQWHNRALQHPISPTTAVSQWLIVVQKHRCPAQQVSTGGVSKGTRRLAISRRTPLGSGSMAIDCGTKTSTNLALQKMSSRNRQTPIPEGPYFPDYACDFCGSTASQQATFTKRKRGHHICTIAVEEAEN